MVGGVDDCKHKGLYAGGCKLDFRFFSILWDFSYIGISLHVTVVSYELLNQFKISGLKV